MFALLLPYLIPSAVTLGTAVLTWVGHSIVALIQNKIKNQNVREALYHVNDVVSAVVTDLAQTTARDLKAAASNGKLGPEDKAAIKAAALERAKMLLGATVEVQLPKALGWSAEQLTAYLSSKIEESVFHLPTAELTAVVVPVAPVVTP